MVQLVLELGLRQTQLLTQLAHSISVHPLAVEPCCCSDVRTALQRGADELSTCQREQLMVDGVQLALGK
jgi:hypothetical protein